MGAWEPRRRQLLRGSLALAGLGVLTGCDALPKMPPAATPPPRVPRVGMMRAAGDADMMFRIGRHLADLGRNPLGNIELAPYGVVGFPQQAVAEMLKRPVDVIMAHGASAAQAARVATSTVPVVMYLVSDPVALGLVSSLAHPGGNVTGLSKSASGAARKRLELLLEMVPAARQISVLWNPTDADARLEFSETAAASAQLGLVLRPIPVSTPADYNAALQAAARDGGQPLLVLLDPMLISNSSHVKLAFDHRLPTMYEERRFVAEEPGLISYGPSVNEQAQRIAYLIDRILSGVQPADLPVYQPNTFDLVVNPKTARALGLTIPPSVLAQATELIQ